MSDEDGACEMSIKLSDARAAGFEAGQKAMREEAATLIERIAYQLECMDSHQEWTEARVIKPLAHKIRAISPSTTEGTLPATASPVDVGKLAARLTDIYDQYSAAATEAAYVVEITAALAGQEQRKELTVRVLDKQECDRIRGELGDGYLRNSNGVEELLDTIDALRAQLAESRFLHVNEGKVLREEVESSASVNATTRVPPPALASPVRRPIGNRFHCYGEIVKNSNGEVVPADEPLFLIRARDYLAVPMLERYRKACVDDGGNDYILELFDEIIQDFVRYKLAHPDKMKQPGITRGL